MLRFGRRAFLRGAAALGLIGCAPKGPDSAGPPSTSAAAATSTYPTATSTSAIETTRQPAPDPTSTTANEAVTPSTVAPGGPARFVRSGDSARAEVALTFHGAGDPDLVGRLADLLTENKVPVTIFAVGQWLDANPKLAARLAADGHELANHTYTHPALGQVDQPTIAREISDCSRALTRVLGNGSRWFRASGIEIPTEEILVEAAAAGYPTVVGYSVDSLDNTDPGATAIVANVAATVDNGSIVSLHTGHADTVEALPALLALLRGRRLQPVTVATLLR